MDPTYWSVYLSDGEVFYQNDLAEHTGWFALRDFVQKNNKQISAMCLIFRSHTVWLPEYKDGYYFAKGMSLTVGESVQHQYIVGWLEGQEVHIKKYRIPELQLVDSETRTIDQCKEFLIYNRAD